MTVTAYPTLTVAGLTVGITTGPGLLALEELSAPWGRAGALDRPTPAATTVSLFDPDGSFAIRTDLAGQPVLLGWSLSDGSASGVLLRGRITDLAFQPRPSGGWIVELGVSSKEVDAANYRAPKATTWPAETVGARLARIVGLLPAGYYPGGVHLPTRLDVGVTDVADPTKDFTDYQLAATDVSEADALSLLNTLMDSVYPVPLVYDPAGDGFTWAPRRRHAYNNAAGRPIVGQLVAQPEYGGRYVAAPVAATGIALDAHLLGFDGWLTRALDTQVTRVEVGYNNGGGTAVRQIASTAAEAVTGRQLLAVDSWLADAGYATQLAGFWADLAADEGAARRLDPVTYDTTRPGGFLSAAHATALLATRETGLEIFLGRSWITRLASRPVYGVIGGTVGYTGGQWQVQLNLLHVSIENPLPAPVTVAGAGAVTLAQLDDSLAVGDLLAVQLGAGYTDATQPEWNG